MSGEEAIALAVIIAIPAALIFNWATEKLWGKQLPPTEHHEPSKWDRML